MAARAQWLEAGTAALATAGAPGVTIDKLAAALGATKGSYYHHFGSVHGYRTALLEHLETVHARRFVALTEAAGGGPEERLRHLCGLVLATYETSDHRPDALETALRAWAQQDPEVLAAQRRIDAVRQDYLRGLWAAAGLPAAEAEAAAWLTHTVLVGGRHLVPALGADDLRRVYDLVFRLVPVPPAAPESP